LVKLVDIYTKAQDNELLQICHEIENGFRTHTQKHRYELALKKATGALHDFGCYHATWQQKSTAFEMMEV
jgi:hypothetical protein